MKELICHYGDVIMGVLSSQITSLTIIYSTVHSGADQKKHQSSASLTFVRGIHRWPVQSSHKWPVTRKMFSFDDVIMWGIQRWYLLRRKRVLFFHEKVWQLLVPFQCTVRANDSLLASLYNPIVNPAMVSTVRFYDRNELYGSPDVRNCRMPNLLGWAFFVISLISIN